MKAVGNHKILSFKQIQYLYFPSYHTLWRRLDKELKPKYLSEPFYIDVGTNGQKTALYRLEKEGKALYKDLTGKVYTTPRWRNLHHLLELNWFLIKLGVKNFELEKDFEILKADAYFNGMAIEVDMGTESKKEILRQYRNYKKLNLKLVYYSNRAEKLFEWIGDSTCKYVRMNDDSIERFKASL